MLFLLLEFTALAAVVVAAGIILAHFADKIAEITRLGHVLVGSVLLAGATSLPELTVDITAVRLNMPDLAAGDLLGSSLMNLLILAVCDLSYHSRGRMLSRESAGHALSGTMSIALTALVGGAILTANSLPDYSLGGVSAAAAVIALAYLLGVRLVFLDQRISARAAADATTGETTTHPPGRLWPSLAGFLFGMVILLLAGPRLAEVAGRVADVSGLGKTFVGTTLVALSTSLPELVASLAALRMRAYDLAIGNIFGSNAFNMLLFVPLDLLHSGPLFMALSPAHVISCLATIVATSIAVMGQLYRIENRHRPLIEPDAWLVITVVAGALYLVYQLG